MPRDRRRVVLQAGPKINLARLPMKSGTAIECQWRFPVTGLDVRAVMHMRDTAGAMVLTFGGRQQYLDLVSVPKPFGGRQWYCLCPRTGRRVSTLWKPPGSPIFASRHAWPRQVAYATQFADRCSRAWATKNRIVRRLDPNAAPEDYDLPRRRPRGMRRRTYERLVDRYWQAERVIDEEFAWAVARLLRHDPTLDFGPKSRG